MNEYIIIGILVALVLVLVLIKAKQQKGKGENSSTSSTVMQKFAKKGQKQEKQIDEAETPATQPASASSSSWLSNLFKKKNKKKITAPEVTAADLASSSSPIVTAPQRTELNDHVRREIENLIRGRNFNVAEAYINQALHQDPTQHGLYLLLAEVHLKQGDDFAYQLLLDRLRQSKLAYLIDELEQRKTIILAHHQQEQNEQNHALLTAAITNAPQAAPQTQSFGIDPIEYVAPSFNSSNQEQSFDDLFSTRSTPAPTASTLEEFHFGDSTQTKTSSPAASSFAHTQTAPKAAPESKQEFDFSNFSLNTSSQAAPVKDAVPPFIEQPKTTIEPAQEFDFSSLNLDTTSVTKTATHSEPIAAKVDTTPTFDFSEFNLDQKPETTATVQPVTAKTEPAPFDFSSFTTTQTESASTPVTPVVEPVTAKTEPAPFDFSSFTTTQTESVSTPVTPVVEPVTAKTEPAPFDFSSFTTTQTESASTPVTPVVEPVTAKTEPAPFDFSSFTTVQTESVSTPVTPVVEPVTAKTEPTPFDFSSFTTVQTESVSTPVTPVVEPVIAKTEPTPFDFSSFTTVQTESVSTPVTPVVEPVTAKTEPTPQEEVVPSFVEPKPAVIAKTESFAIPTIEAQPIATKDPLVQAFPNLTHYKEAEINLKLAEQYISLGAYDAARNLLQNQSFNPEQQLQANDLLERLAS